MPLGVSGRGEKEFDSGEEGGLMDKWLSQVFETTNVCIYSYVLTF